MILKSKADDDKINQLLQALEQTPIAVSITDKRGVLEYGNTVFIEQNGKSLAELSGSIAPFFEKNQKVEQALYDDLWEKVNSGQAWQGVLCTQTKDKPERWNKIMISPISNSLDCLTHFVCVNEDVTKQREDHHMLLDFREKAVAFNKTKSIFLA